MEYNRRLFSQNKKFVLFFLLGLILNQTVAGQSSSLYLLEDSHSPTQTEFMNHILRPEMEMYNHFLSNPALLHLMINDDSSFRLKKRTVIENKENEIFVTTGSSFGKHSGDYLPYEGKTFRDFSLRAIGYTRSEKATFFGKAGFVSGKQQKTDWNTLRFPALYWPYIVADSTGGNLGYEEYNLMCAYSFTTRALTLGFSGEYKGDFAYRQNDPRIENITSWLTLKAGAAYRYKNHLFAVDLSYLLHRQHMDLHHFRTGQFAGFFIEYGFGMFDYVHSPIFRSMKQQQHITNYGINLSFNSDPAKDLRVQTGLTYNYDLMTTEENLYKLNLYRALTHQLHFTNGILWSNNVWGAGLFTDVSYQRKRGQENLFERYVSSVIDGVNVYDYKKIGEQDRYRLNLLNGKTHIKLSYFLNRNYTISLLGGVTYFMRDETYKERDYQIKNELLTPSVGFEFNYEKRSFELQLKGNWAHRYSLNKNYRVQLNMERHTEFQHAFTTYAYYANNADILTAEVTLAKQFGFGKAGILAQLFYVKGERLSDVVYDQAKYAEALPAMGRNTISLTPDVHNASWGKVGLFLIF